MNPHWTQLVHHTLKRLTRVCPHCGRKAVYEGKKTGQFYTCKKCGHRFMEKSK